ncbi:MAG: hypothetical protein KGJ57_10475 [Sphingomonadales bacterium]|nr:hypothetical protein [Sphingomonadales bacterium]MDE2169838.1 hypothetical protein [Sphingomonadales bacterium]
MNRYHRLALAWLSASPLLLSPALQAQPAGSSASSPGGPGAPPAMPSMADTHYDTVVEVRDGRLVKGQPGPVLGATFSHGLHVNTRRDGLNGVFVSGGRSVFSLKDATIHLVGMGRNDFLGIGAGALVRDGAAMAVDHADIDTRGATAAALVAAEGATLRVYDSHLVTHGGPLPKGYVRHIGPGMMEPPPPLGLDGDARTFLAMSDSRSYLYRTTIESDGWGALSTDAAGTRLYAEANDCTIIVHRRGYGAYADFGAHVVLNRTTVESGGEAAIIAGAARIDLNAVTAHAQRNGVMIHSVMGNPQEVAILNLVDTSLSSDGPALLIKSANARITVEGGKIASATGQLLLLRKNEDANATQTHGATVPGVTLTLRKVDLSGAIESQDKDRTLTLKLEGARLAGALHHVVLQADQASHWHATADSQIVLGAGLPLQTIDAPAGVKVAATAQSSAITPGTYPLASGGTLLVTTS